MDVTVRKVAIILQVLVSVFVALYAIDISDDIISDLYIKIEGHYLPFGGLPHEYYFWVLFLAGTLSVVASYILLYNIKNRSYIAPAMLLIPFMFFALYEYQISGKPYLSYEIIVGGLIPIGLYEVIRKTCF